MRLPRDVSGVVELLSLVFRPSLDLASQRALHNSLSLGHGSWLMLRLSQVATGIPPGFIWEEDGRVVGNVSVLRPKGTRRFLVANVAVHPNYRRRGIARGLMEVTIGLVRAHQGEMIMLQVESENAAAIGLYQGLGFEILGESIWWTIERSRIQPLGVDDSPPIRPLPGRAWREAIALDALALSPEFNWPQPPPADFYKGGWWRRLDDIMNGRRRETWVTTDDHGRLTGLGHIDSEWGRPHLLKIRVHPAWRGRLERPLLAKLLRRVDYLARRAVRVEHPATDTHLNDLLREANFRRRRALTTMRLRLTP